MYCSRIKAVGGHIDDLPTYDQVMLEDQTAQCLPSYYPSQRPPSGGILAFGLDDIPQLPLGQEIFEIASAQVLAALRRESCSNAEEDERRVQRLSPHIVEFLMGVKRALSEANPPSNSAIWNRPSPCPKEPSKTITS